MNGGCRVLSSAAAETPGSHGTVRAGSMGWPVWSGGTGCTDCVSGACGTCGTGWERRARRSPSQSGPAPFLARSTRVFAVRVSCLTFLAAPWRRAILCVASSSLLLLLDVPLILLDVSLDVLLVLLVSLLLVALLLPLVPLDEDVEGLRGRLDDLREALAALP